MALHAVTLFLGAFLLFQVQPLVGKLLLPAFGGASAVWMTCMMFFQTLLLLGYAYAHLVASRLSPRAQAWTHGALLAAMVPLLPPETSATGLEAATAHPTLSVLRVLLTTIGFPFFVIASTSPLLQIWFARLYPNRSPYRLYATSNCGSLLALVCYPAWIEPNVSLRGQAWTWSLAVVALVLLLWACAAAARRAHAARPLDTAEPAPDGVTQGLWLALAAAGSVLLLGATNQLSQNVAPVPFLWILPLALYLLTFILCFESDRFYSRNFLGWMLVSAILGMVASFVWSTELGLIAQVGFLSYALFAGCMVCHGELARSRPAPAHLTRFYLLVSAGGALGGVLVTVVAPLVFPSFWELPIAVAVACLLRLIGPRLVSGDPSAARSAGELRRGRMRVAAMLAGCVAVLALLGPPAWAGFLQRNDILAFSRNFYGVLRVTDKGRGEPRLVRRELTHGNTLHGMQFLAEDRRRTPTTYYGPGSGVAKALQRVSSRSASPRIGLVGLGVGTLAAYAEAGMSLRFYELDPEVVEVAEERFSFLRDARDRGAELRIVTGDGRRVLAAELEQGAGGELDLLVLDAFSSDAIPMHLLTVEALEVYLRHLRDNGVLAVHVSNRYLDLSPVVRALARSRGLASTRVDDPGVDEDGTTRSEWILISRDVALLDGLEGVRDDGEQAAVLWTDDYSSLLPLLR